MDISKALVAVFVRRERAVFPRMTPLSTLHPQVPAPALNNRYRMMAGSSTTPDSITIILGFRFAREIK